MSLSPTLSPTSLGKYVSSGPSMDPGVIAGIVIGFVVAIVIIAAAGVRFMYVSLCFMSVFVMFLIVLHLFFLTYCSPYHCSTTTIYHPCLVVSFGRHGCCGRCPSCHEVCSCGDTNQDKCPPPTCTCCDYQPPLPPLPPATASFVMSQQPGNSTYCAVSNQVGRHVIRLITHIT